MLSLSKHAFRNRKAAGGVLLAATLVGSLGSGLPFGGADAYPTAVVREGAFHETLIEAGTVSAARLMLYGSTIAGTQAKILELAPEGTSVRAGDLLVRFDPAVFEQNLQKEEAGLMQARGELLRTRQELQLERLRAEAEIDAARQQLSFAESDVANATDGEGQLAVLEAEAATAEAGRELQRARTNCEDLRPLLTEGFITRAELDRAEQALRRAEEQQRLAQAKRDTLVRYQRPSTIGKSKAELNIARSALARAGDSAAARLAQRQAAVAIAESREAEFTARLAAVRDQIGRTVIRADGPGLVVYRDLFFGSDRRKPQVGDEVWPNQPLVAVPDSSQLIVDTRVREVDLHRVARSQRVHVSIDAYPDVRLPAAVSLIGALAQEDTNRAGTKFFPVTVRLLTADARLRTGMTAKVEIEINTLPRAAIVPLQALFGEPGQRHCFVARARGPARVRVEVAGENEQTAAVVKGLAVGDRVLLVDPAPASSHAANP